MIELNFSEWGIKKAVSVRMKEIFGQIERAMKIKKGKVFVNFP